MAKLLLRVHDQCPADALTLVGDIDSQIRKVTGVVKIGNRSGNTDELLSLPGRDQDIGIPDHALDALSILNWSSLTERRSVEHIDELVCADFGVDLVIDRHSRQQPNQ